VFFWRPPPFGPRSASVCLSDLSYSSLLSPILEYSSVLERFFDPAILVAIDPIVLSYFSWMLYLAKAQSRVADLTSLTVVHMRPLLFSLLSLLYAKFARRFGEK